MAIQEIPINTDEPPVNEEAQEIEAAPELEAPELEVAQEPEEVEEPATPMPKRRGRPPGAKNRAKPKPPPVIKRSRRPPTPASSEEEEEYEEAPPRRRAQQVEEDPVRTVAAEMLHLMQVQNRNRQQARVNKYASWFQQSYA